MSTTDTKGAVPTAISKDYFGSPMVRVIVGGANDTPNQLFYVHADLIISRSLFFAKALKGFTQSNIDSNSVGEDKRDIQESATWQEGSEGVVKLPEDNHEVFSDYVQLLYSGVITVFKKLDKSALWSGNRGNRTAAEVDQEYSKTLQEACSRELDRLANIYVLCEKLQDTESKSLLISSILETYICLRSSIGNYVLPVSATETIYAGTLPSDPVRELWADFFVFDGESGWLKKDEAFAFPHEYMVDVIAGILTHRPVPTNTIGITQAPYYQRKLRNLDGCKQKNTLQ